MLPGDILIHAGYYTRFGTKVDAIDFNEWMDELPYRHKLVVQGNHETNAEWKKYAEHILGNAKLLRHEAFELSDEDINVFGSEFFWPCESHNPYYDQIPDDVDILIAHNPSRHIIHRKATLTRVEDVPRCDDESNQCLHRPCWWSAFTFTWLAIYNMELPLILFNTVFVNAANA